MRGNSAALPGQGCQGQPKKVALGPQGQGWLGPDGCLEKYSPFLATKIRLFPPLRITEMSSHHKTLLLRYLNAARQQRQKQQRILYLLASGTKRPG